jgi:hypothetical protein
VLRLAVDYHRVYVEDGEPLTQRERRAQAGDLLLKATVERVNRALLAIVLAENDDRIPTIPVTGPLTDPYDFTLDGVARLGYPHFWVLGPKAIH